ncbi:MAG: methionine--tRNA ligase subunit beta [Candidatus Micrarchaeota archaeon]|nr:methionine--tRNA ligase subunit beta [Candidatus Micrarchaeota archaeon]
MHVQSDFIKFDEFAKIKLVIGKIVSVEDIQGSDKLYKIKVSLGEKEQRILVAGLKEFYKKEELINKKIVLLANLEPKKIRNIESQGMLLAADSGKNVRILTVDDAENIPEGSLIR